MPDASDSSFTKPAYPPLTIADVYAAMAALERHRKRLVCAPDVVERVQAAVRQSGLEGAYQILENRLLKDGQVVLMASKAEMEALYPPVTFNGQREAPAGEAGA